MDTWPEGDAVWVQTPRERIHARALVPIEPVEAGEEVLVAVTSVHVGVAAHGFAVVLGAWPPDVPTRRIRRGSHRPRWSCCPTAARHRSRSRASSERDATRPSFASMGRARARARAPASAVRRAPRSCWSWLARRRSSPGPRPGARGARGPRPPVGGPRASFGRGWAPPSSTPTSRSRWRSSRCRPASDRPAARSRTCTSSSRSTRRQPSTRPAGAPRKPRSRSSPRARPGCSRADRGGQPQVARALEP